MSDIREIHAPRTVRARREHTCSGCGWPILPGWHYVRTGYADGDSRWTWREHPPCHGAICEYSDGDGLPEGWIPGYDDDDGELCALWLAVGLGVDAVQPIVAPRDLQSLADECVRFGLPARALHLRAAEAWDREPARHVGGKVYGWEFAAAECRRLAEETP